MRITRVTSAVIILALNWSMVVMGQKTTRVQKSRKPAARGTGGNKTKTSPPIENGKTTAEASLEKKLRKKFPHYLNCRRLRKINFVLQSTNFSEK